LNRREKDAFVKKLFRQPDFQKLREYALSHKEKIRLEFLCFIRSWSKGAYIIAATRFDVKASCYVISFNINALREGSLAEILLTFAHELGHVEIGWKSCSGHKDKVSCPLEETEATARGLKILKKLGLLAAVSRNEEMARLFSSDPLVKPIVCSDFIACLDKRVKGKRKRDSLLELRQWRLDYEKEKKRRKKHKV